MRPTIETAGETRSPAGNGAACRPGAGTPAGVPYIPIRASMDEPGEGFRVGFGRGAVRTGTGRSTMDESGTSGGAKKARLRASSRVIALRWGAVRKNPARNSSGLYRFASAIIKTRVCFPSPCESATSFLRIALWSFLVVLSLHLDQAAM